MKNTQNNQNTRWPETLSQWRPRFTRQQWKDYISEICWHISYNQKNSNSLHDLTQEEYYDCNAFMHGKL
tara:strand:+ start:915 stop:1121 length:207 start_codon:yes stop_codon:yes gene_type:complete